MFDWALFIIPSKGTNSSGLHALVPKCKKVVERSSQNNSFCNFPSASKSCNFIDTLGGTCISCAAPPLAIISPRGPINLSFDL